jgi:hypothetical protein
LTTVISGSTAENATQITTGNTSSHALWLIGFM